MKKIIMVVAVLSFSALVQGAPAAESRTAEESKGLTVDDLGRGLKSAAKNVENEIPKIGAAIGSAVKKITEKGQDKPSPQMPAKQNK
jgi:peptidoglycan hydrolase CwlO-like protein